MKVLFNNGNRPVSVCGIIIQPKSEYVIDVTFLTSDMISVINALVNANMLEVSDRAEIIEPAVQEDLPEVIEPAIEENNESVIEEDIQEEPIKKTTRKTTSKKKTSK